MTAGCGACLEALVSKRATQRPLGPSVASGLMPDTASASGTAPALLRYAPTFSVRRVGGGALLKHVLTERPTPWITGIEESFPFEKRLFSNQTTPMGAPVSLTTDAGASSFPELAAEEPAELVATVREGLPTERFDALRELLDVPSGRLAEIVGITPSTLSRRRKHGTFNKDESERILRVARLALRAIDVLDGRNNAQKWLTEPARALGGEPPLDFADTEPGAREVERLLIRLDHGVYS